jgi:hypothetical protein
VRYGRKLTLVALATSLVVLGSVSSTAAWVKLNTQFGGGGSWRAPDPGLWTADQSTGGFSVQNQSVNGLDSCTLYCRDGYRDCKNPCFPGNASCGDSCSRQVGRCFSACH